MGMRAWKFRFPVRLSCGHLVTYSGTPPAWREPLLCPCCGRTVELQDRYYDPSRPASWCGHVAWDGAVLLRCTLDGGHDVADKHYDGPRDTVFAHRDRLRSSREGSC